MSLFMAYSKAKGSTVQPKSVKIEGDVNGSYYSGRVEMAFLNDSQIIEKYDILIGQSSGNSILTKNLNQ